MKNALNNQVGMLGNMFLWLVANLKQGVIYFIKQACGNEIMPSVYVQYSLDLRYQCVLQKPSIGRNSLGRGLFFVVTAF